MNNNTKFVTFENLPVFKQAHDLALTIYKITNLFPKAEIYGLTSQIRRSAASVAANIVEGLHRSSKKELIQYSLSSQSFLRRNNLSLNFDKRSKVSQRIVLHRNKNES